MRVSWPIIKSTHARHYALNTKYKYEYKHIPAHHVLECILAIPVIRSKLARLAWMNKKIFSQKLIKVCKAVIIQIFNC